MADAVVRYGVIGTGMMGCEHIRHLREVLGVEITAIADADERSRVWGSSRWAARSMSTPTVVDFDGGARGLLDLCMFASTRRTSS